MIAPPAVVLGDVTATGKPVGRRISAANISPIARTSAFVVSTETPVARVMLNAAPDAVTSDAGDGTSCGGRATRCGGGGGGAGRARAAPGATEGKKAKTRPRRRGGNFSGISP